MLNNGIIIISTEELYGAYIYIYIVYLLNAISNKLVVLIMNSSVHIYSVEHRLKNRKARNQMKQLAQQVG